MQSKLYICFFILSVVLCSCVGGFYNKERKAAFKVIDEVVEKYENKYGLSFSGVSESAPSGKYSEIGISFSLNKILEKDEGRKIVLEIATDFLDRINQDSKLKNYLEVYPFDFSNITINIFLKPVDGQEIYYPNFRIFSCYNNHVYFGFYEKLSDGERSLLQQESETIEEARQIVNQQNKLENP